MVPSDACSYESSPWTGSETSCGCVISRNSSHRRSACPRGEAAGIRANRAGERHELGTSWAAPAQVELDADRRERPFQSRVVGPRTVIPLPRTYRVAFGIAMLPAKGFARRVADLADVRHDERADAGRAGLGPLQTTRLASGDSEQQIQLGVREAASGDL